MKKIIFIIFSFLIFTPTIFAWGLPNFSKIKIDKNIFDVLTQPTATPTQAPTNTPPPTIEPTETPTETPIPTETQAPTQLETITETPSSQISPTTIQKTPTPTQKPTQLNQKDIIMYGVIGFLVLVVLLQNCPKIKRWLHEKTE